MKNLNFKTESMLYFINKMQYLNTNLGSNTKLILKSIIYAIKKTHSLRFGLHYCLIQRSPQLELDYFLCFLIKILSSKDIKKLTIAPMDARIIVFRISSECKFGKTLKNVPPAVPTNVALLCCNAIVYYVCQLANCRNNATYNGYITANSNNNCW